MITIHLHLPGSQDEQEYAVYALSDGEAVTLPSRYCAPDAHETIHFANEIAFNAFRLAVASDKISPTNIRWRAHTPEGVIKGRINEFGVPLTDDGERRTFRSPGDTVIEELLITAAQKSKRIRMEKLRVLEEQRDAHADNCKGIEHEQDKTIPPSVG
jgi:hypothetical protein